MSSRLADAIRSMGEEEFTRRMETLSGAQRRELFHELDVPPAGPSASARKRNLRRIQAAWERLAATGDEEAAEIFARHWLSRNAMPMIVEFLDGMGVEHNDGYLKDENALGNLEPEAISAALGTLASRHDASDVHLYAALMDLPEPGQD